MFEEVYQSVMLVRYLYYFDNNLLLSSVVLSFKKCVETISFLLPIIFIARSFLEIGYL